MASFGLFSAIVFVTIISTSQAIDFYQPVDGKCTDLPIAKGYNSTKAASGDWYFQYGSFGKEGDRCSFGHVVQRGNRDFIDNLMYNADTKDFNNMPNDLTDDAEKPGVYTSDQGAVGYMLATDPEMKEYFYYIQCMEKNNKTLVMVMVGSRRRSTTKELEKDYRDISKMLEEKKLLPKMHKIIQTGCDGI